MTKKLISTAIAGGFIAGFALVSTPATSAEVTLRTHTFIPPVANPGKTFVLPWSRKVEAASKGRIKVENYWTMQLGGKPTQLLDQARDGVVDVVLTLPGYTPGRMPKSEVVELPFLHTTPQATTFALTDLMDTHLKKEWSEYKVISNFVHAGSMFMMRGKPILKMSDLKGRKIRTATRTGVWYLKALGAVPVPAPLPSIPQMLSKGVIEGAMLPFEIAPAVKMQELVSHFSELSGSQPRMNTSIISLLMHPGSYNKMPPDLKKVIDGLSGRNIAKWAGQNWADIEIPAKKIM